ncbi:hypothetical protein [Adhaeribacter rhizoryzae]|uniref:Lipocalin-like domain-containing protein n=1 Tax=Adhaeribacter rhizoryzae TaxID=2607907 RepID=A0A5M6DMY7_9BACT|nr:hypothetical protein [Adhaeribacter rhizoryzae]KAA5547520.1 hypothetical protein F0145_09380 [Adhaeribacter rhizoryzae]
MKKLLLILLTLTPILFFSSCKKEVEDVKVEEEKETLLQMQTRLLKGKWQFKEALNNYFDQNGKPIEAKKSYPFIGDKTTYSFDGKLYTIDYDPFYNRIPDVYPYTVTQEADQQIYLNLEGFILRSGKVHSRQISVIFDELDERLEIHYDDGRMDIIFRKYIRMP